MTNLHLSRLHNFQIDALVAEFGIALRYVHHEDEPTVYRAVETVIDLLVDYRNKRNGGGA